MCTRFETILGYVVRHCIKRKKEKETKSSKYPSRDKNNFVVS